MHDLDNRGAVEGGCSGEVFMWTDSTMNDFSNFSPGEPNDWSDGQAHCTHGCDDYWSPSGGGCDDDAVGVAAGTGGEDCVLQVRIQAIYHSQRLDSGVFLRLLLVWTGSVPRWWWRG